MLPDRVSNPGPLTYQSGALPIALRGPADSNEGSQDIFEDRYVKTDPEVSSNTHSPYRVCLRQFLSFHNLYPLQKALIPR